MNRERDGADSEKLSKGKRMVFKSICRMASEAVVLGVNDLGPGRFVRGKAWDPGIGYIPIGAPPGGVEMGAALAAVVSCHNDLVSAFTGVT
eukprot:944059-Amorphochlora_amoeboformis.AAC.1